jgi:hypothetical protein
MSDIFGSICTTDADRYKYLISIQNKYSIRGLSIIEIDWMACYQSKKANDKAADFYWAEVDKRTEAARALKRTSVKGCSFFSAQAYVESDPKKNDNEWEKRAVEEYPIYKAIDQGLDKYLAARREKKKDDAKMDSFKTPRPF